MSMELFQDSFTLEKVTFKVLSKTKGNRICSLPLFVDLDKRAT